MKKLLKSDGKVEKSIKHQKNKMKKIIKKDKSNKKKIQTKKNV